MAKTFSDQVRREIRRSGVSQYAIGKACGIDTGNLSKFMAGEAGISVAKLDAIAAMIGLQVILVTKKKVSNGKRGK